MVRVIPVHNFLSQNVGQIDEPTASCTANVQGQDMLLLALSSHCVKVYGLASSQSKLLTVFPTVDSVNQLLHSDKGNYVATLESKNSRDGTTTNNFVRIYVNWEMSGNQNQAMRARIAGRVTPSLNRTLNSLEMIELPLNSQPTHIACCQTTGNLLVVMEREAVIHELKVETQQLSKQKFLDFEVRPWSLKFTFSPSHVQIAEEFITVMNSTSFMIFKLTNQFNDDMMNNVESINNTKNTKKRMNQNAKIAMQDLDSSDTDKRLNKKRNSQTKSIIDYKKSVINERSFIDWDQLVSKEGEELERLELLKIIDPASKDFNIILDSVSSDTPENSQSLDPPVVPAPEICATITTSSNEDSWSENYIIEHVLRLKVVPTSAEATKDFGNDYFTCCGMKPSYWRSKTLNTRQKKSLLRSQKYNVFNGVTCIVCTAQEGYLYHFSPSIKEEITQTLSSCTIYPFTSPVSHVALENTALHALTEAGLESYTLRLPHMKTRTNIECEDHNEPDTISLIGLRPFLGVKKLLQAAKCLVLLASDQDNWTYYSLILPKPEDVYYDILSAANNHKASSPCTYKHLLGEAYTVLKLAKDMVYYSSDVEYSRNVNDTSRSYLDNLYRQSCGLLADYFVSSTFPYDWNSCISYYKLAGLSAPDVLGRKDVTKASGVIVYLSDVLLTLQSGPEADALFQEHNIVEILGSAEKEDLLKLIVASPVLREYATEKLIHVLSGWEATDPNQFALVLLYTQAERQQLAEKALEGISDRYITEATLANWSWLFDVTSVKKGNVIPTFSDYAGIFMRQRTRIFADVIARLVAEEALTLNQMIQIFLAYLPSRVGRDGRLAAGALQLSLETYFKGIYVDGERKREDAGENDVAVLEGFKILVRSYLGELAQGQSQRSEEREGKDVLFGNFRPEFLDHPILYKNDGVKGEIRMEVIKLQALLASGYLSNECYEEVKRFLETQSIEGGLSFKLLCVRDTEKGIQLLAERCPQVLLMYAKDKYTKESEWKYFVQFLIHKINESPGDPQAFTIYDELLKDTAIYIAQTMSMRGLQRVLPNDNSIPSLQQYMDISSQVVHADYIKTMIMGTGQHLLTNINF
uniref:HPS3 protein n=1 Tax=Fopius arisanus TaxID=64838 RepID=A0A0C9RKX0_9HYME